MNLIKKMFYKEQPKIEIEKEYSNVQTETLTIKEREIVEKIHNEIDTAQDRLLDQAEQLLQELNIPTETRLEEKAERLSKIGFVNSETVLRNNKVKEQIQKIQVKVVSTKEFANLIKYYKQTYPFQKFLTEDELNRICEKYKLIYAPIANYSKDVPEKNLRDIENTSPLKYEDVIKFLYKIVDFIFWDGNTKEYRNFIKDNILNKIFPYDSVTESNIMNFVKIKGFTGKIGGTYNFRNATVDKIDKSGLFIAAPQSHFNLKDVSQEEKYGFFKKTVTEIKDPIVFEYCRGGMIRVITKWGLEGNDEILTNPIEN